MRDVAEEIDGRVLVGFFLRGGDFGDALHMESEARQWAGDCDASRRPQANS